MPGERLYRDFGDLCKNKHVIDIEMTLVQVDGFDFPPPGGPAGLLKPAGWSYDRIQGAKRPEAREGA